MSLLGGSVPGLPRIGTLRQTSPKIIFLDGQVQWALAGGRIIDGNNARDPDNAGLVTNLRPGLIMGKITSSGLYGSSISGLTSGAYSGGTTLTVTTQCAVEIVRRFGASGTFKLTGPPTAAGVVATQTVTYSAVNTTNGNVTITALAANAVSGSLIRPVDGSEDPLTFISEFINAGTGVSVVDIDGVTNLSVPFNWFPVGGVIIASNIINYPADASLKAWLKTQLAAIGYGKFTFNDQY